MKNKKVKLDKDGLTPLQAAFVKHRASGKGRDQSAILAGGAPSGSIDKSPKVQIALAREQAEYAQAGKATKESVMQMLQDAFDMAKMMADPGGMVAAAREIGKMAGFYAPEIKKVQHELGNRTLAALENLSDSELLQIANGRVIDGEATRLENDDPDGGAAGGSPCGEGAQEGPEGGGDGPGEEAPEDSAPVSEEDP